LEASAFDLVAGAPGTPRRNFAVSKSLTQSLTVGGVASKRREYTESPPERTPTGGVGSRCKRSRNRVLLSERVLGASVINPPSAGPRAVRRGRGSLEHLT